MSRGHLMYNYGSEREAKATPTGQTLRTNEVSDSSSSSQSESGSERQDDSDSSRSSSPDSGIRAQKLQAVRDRHMTTPVTQSRRFSRVASTDVFDMDYDMTPQTPGSDLPVHDPVTNPAVGVLNQVPRSQKNKPSHAATSSKKSESAMPLRKMSDCDNPDWFNFDCPPTPGDPVSSKHGFSEPSSVVQKTEAKKGNKRQTSARAQSSSGETAQVSNGSSESKRKSKKKMARLFGSFSPPASSSGSTPTQEEGLQVTNIKPVTVEPFVDTFDSDDDNKTPERPQTPGSDLPVHDPVTNPAVGVLNQVPRSQKNKPSHAATSSKKSESAMPLRKMSDCDNPDWFNFDCPPTPGDPVSSKHGFSEPSSVVQKTEAKKGNKRQTSARAQSSSGETAQVSNGSSESKRKSKKKMARLFGSFSPPASSSGSTPTQEEGLQVTNIKPVTVEPFVDTFDSDDDNKTPERPQTPGSDLPVHDPVTNPAVGVLNQVPRSQKNKPSHAATSSKKSESAMPLRKMSDCDNPDWFNFDCPPTPGDPVSSKHGFSEPSSVG
ncbi:dentin sialophosphoprotein-like [Penaeus indicus]|uniref:dentin sialophosphoprotein-like n=1 Tax=Penaeus indicus TaxID=29960 RepID=UPI00300D910C